MKLSNIFTFLVFLSTSEAFAPVSRRPFLRSVELAAEGGAPKYDKRSAKLIEAEKVADGSVMLHISTDDDGEALDYKPGNVLALEIERPKSMSLNDEKIKQDTEQNGGWVRGPYTVSRASETSFDVLIRVVGDKSRLLATSEPGTPLRFGGKFHVPIYEGINTADTKRVVFISTGVGIGPCVGAVEEMVADIDFEGQVDLLASFRDESDVIYRDYLDNMAKENAGRFNWTPIITSKMGRISDSEDNIQMAISKEFCSLKDTHYHLIGNGQLVNEWKEGLLKAGVSEEKVTIESYFNHRAGVDTKRIERIANVISNSVLSPAV